MKQKIADLVYLSHQIGNRLDYVQGGGGNISVKISPDLMVIKASGYELKNVTQKDGFAFVKQNLVNHEIGEFVKNKNGDDEKFAITIKATTVVLDGYSALRPSMETGFHSLLPFSYVIHSHNVYAGILNCAKEGKEIAQKLFPDALWIDYKNPGWQVTEAIYLAIKNKKPSPQIIFLQNHGLIVAAEDVKSALDLHEMVTKKILDFFKIPQFEENNISEFSNDFMKKNVLFPDQIVFGISEEFAKTKIANHIFSAYSYILKMVDKCGLKPLFVSDENVEFVTNMESEKYRKEVAKK